MLMVFERLQPYEMTRGNPVPKSIFEFDEI